MAIAWATLLNGRQAEVRHALRVATAAAVSFGLAKLLHLPQGFWAVITAIVVVQTSLGGTLVASRERLIGTGVGALVGSFAAWVRPQEAWGELIAIALSVGVLGLAAAIRPSLKVAPVTAVIMIVGSGVGQHGFLATGLLRVAEIALGGVIGVMASLLVFPARARDAVSAKAQGALDDLSTLLELYARRLGGEVVEEEMSPLHARVRSALGVIEKAVGEASRESAARLTGTHVGDAIPRTLWRLRNDAVMIGRASSHGWPGEVSARLGEPAAALLRAQAAHLKGLSGALARRQASPATDLSGDFARFREGVQQLEREVPPGDLTFERLEQIFGLAYALEAFNRNVADLAERIAEFNGRRGD
jgi:uncharacterized membrane protein YccC